MVKVRIEDNTGDVNEMEGRFVWGAIEVANDETAAFAVGRTDIQKLVVRMAQICTSILLTTFKLEREDPAAQIVRDLFQYSIDKEFEEESFKTKTVKEHIEKVKE